MRAFNPMNRLFLQLSVALLILVACSEADSAGQDDTATNELAQDVADTGVTDTGSEIEPAPGRILVSSTAITGHQGHVLLVFGPGTRSEICATIDSDPWTLGEVALTDRTADSDPCGGAMDNTLFDAGEHAVSASIFEPGTQTPLSSTATLVAIVDGDAQLQLDGSKLSGTTTGDPGRILVTASEITGQAGKILVVLAQNNAASLCATIDTDPWALPTPAAMTELPGGDNGPCGDGTPEMILPGGDTVVTAAVLVPGSQSAEATTSLLVTVDGDAIVAIDGAQLSPTTTSLTVPTAMTGATEIPTDTASAVTGPPADMSGINSHHDLLRSPDSRIRFGTQADPATVTLGPTDGGEPSWTPYEGKHSLNFKMPRETSILAPLDVRFVGFKNRSAEYRQDTETDDYLSPFDDLELCFESVSDDWPGLVLCVYHLYTSPLLQAHLDDAACGIQERWDGGGAEAGRIYYLNNSTERSRNDSESCQPLLGSIINRGGVIGYSGQVGDNPHSAFRFKVHSEDRNPLTAAGDPYLHWVQPSAFFYWQCFEPDAVFQPGVLAYPFDCELI